MSEDPTPQQPRPTFGGSISLEATSAFGKAMTALHSQAFGQAALLRDYDFSRIIGNIVSTTTREHLAAIQAQIARIVMPNMPQIDLRHLLPKIELPDLSAFIFPQLEEVTKGFAEIFRNLEGIQKTLWPANLRGLSSADREEVLRIILDEGIPFTWVPPSNVVDMLVSADRPAARRQILVNRRRSIVTSCYELVEDAVQRGASKTDEHYIRAALSALEDEHFEAAQALATLQLDTMVNRDLGKSLRIEITKRDQGAPTLDDYPPTTAFVVGAIWASHLRYRPEDGDEIPREYTRHGSVHGVSRRQYTRANAIISVMHISALLRASISQPKMIKEVYEERKNS